MKNPLRFLVAVAATLLLGVSSSHANQVTVQDIGFDPGAKIAAVSAASLAGSPKPPGTMSSARASEVCKLWDESYGTTASTDGTAGLQTANYGVHDVINRLGTYTGASADLIALTVPKQDNVIPRAPVRHVPDQGSALLLLGVASLTLLAARAVRTKFSQAVLGC